MRLLILGLLAVTLSPALAAQSVSATPNYGTVSLQAGFMPDPHTTNVVAGGTVAVRMGGCTYGKVSNAPDLDLRYDNNSGNTLYVYAVSDADVTLLVNAPDGTWLCDDDSHGNRNPILVIPKAASGLYNIWVGTYGDQMTNARLYVSEVDPRR